MLRFRRNDARRRQILCALGAGVLVALLILSGCKAQAELHSAYDPVTDFSGFHSFNFVPMAGARQPGSTRLAQKARRAIASELQKRGYVLDPHYPDLLVNFSNNVTGKATSAVGGRDYYDYRFYGSWQGYPISDEFDSADFPRGTLSVDLIDASRMQLVWEGMAVAEVSEPESKEGDAELSQTIAHIFTRYPFNAANSSVKDPE
jgi:hypothetical protein